MARLIFSQFAGERDVVRPAACDQFIDAVRPQQAGPKAARPPFPRAASIPAPRSQRSNGGRMGANVSRKRSAWTNRARWRYCSTPYED